MLLEQDARPHALIASYFHERFQSLGHYNPRRMFLSEPEEKIPICLTVSIGDIERRKFLLQTINSRTVR